jgi:polysaccharide chain length determinant protein (PEP-CTERM system associated)
MELNHPEIQRYLGILIKRKYLFIFVSLSVMSVIVWGSYFIPKKYKAESMVFVEQSIIKELVEDIAINPSIDQRIRVLRYAMLSRTNILNVIRDLDLDTTVSEGKEMEALIEAFRKKTRIDIKGNDLFIISILDPHPRLARDYINTLVRKYVEEVVEAKREDSYGANRFINEQVEYFKQKLEEIDDAIIKFRQQQGIYIALDEKSVIQDIQQYQEELHELKVKKNELSSVQGILRNQLNMMEPYTVATYTHNRSVAVESAVDMYEKRIAQHLTRYTENHPDVVKLRAELEAVKKGTVKEEEMVGGTDEIEPETSAVNPVYQSVEKKIFETEAEIEALKSRSAQFTAAIRNKEGELKYIPESKKALAILQHERDSQKALYNRLLERQGQAWVSKKMEIEDKSATFKIVDPAVLPQTHATPDMKKMVLIGIFLGFFGGLGGVFLREQFDTSIKDKSALADLGLPVLGVIPKVFNVEELRKIKRTERLAYTFAGLYFCLIGSALLFEIMGLPYISTFFQGLPVDRLGDVVSSAKEMMGR